MLPSSVHPLTPFGVSSFSTLFKNHRPSLPKAESPISSTTEPFSGAIIFLHGIPKLKEILIVHLLTRSKELHK